MTISACIMVKNEEDFIEPCLKSIRNVVDEIILMDTGSVDGTVKKAAPYVDRMIHEPWKQDFSYHRNTLKQFASCDWILSIDGDEVMIEITEDALINSIKEAEIANANVCCFRLYNFGYEIPIVLVAGYAKNQALLYRNIDELKWYGRRHNKLSLKEPTKWNPSSDNPELLLPANVDVGTTYMSPTVIFHHYGRIKRNWLSRFIDQLEIDNPSFQNGNLDYDKAVTMYLDSIGIKKSDLHDLPTVVYDEVCVESPHKLFLYDGPYPKEVNFEKAISTRLW